MLRIAVDFDGTLFALTESGELEPIPGAPEALQDLKSRGIYIIIHTCRTGLARSEGFLNEEVALIEQALQDACIPYDEIHVGTKPVATLYVDDRAVRFSGDWSETAEEILNRLQRRD